MLAHDAALHARLYGPSAGDVPAIVPPSAADEVPGPAPLSFAQERIWFYDQVYPGDPLYHLADVWRLRGALDVALLQRSLDALVREHPSLRTRIVTIDDVPMQIVGDARPFPIERVDGAGIDDAVARAVEAARRPFDLAAQAPLGRALLVRLADDDHVLAFVFHHVVKDGASMSIVYESIARAAADPERAAEPREGTVSPAAFARWQRRLFAPGAPAKQRDFWRTLLADVPRVALRTDRPHPPQRSRRGARVWAQLLDAQDVAALRAIAHGNGATMFAALLAAYAAALHVDAGQAVFPVGFPAAGRSAELDGVVGCFINMLVLRADFTGAPTFDDAVARVRDALANALDNRDVPFDLIVKAVGPKRDFARMPLFDVMLNVQSIRTPRFTFPGVDAEEIAFDYGIANYDHTLTLTERADGLEARLQYNTDVFERATAAAFLDVLGAVLRGAVRDPGAPLQRV